MPEITTELVAQLRERTGAGLGDCRRALIQANGDIEVAIDSLRKKGVATAAKKAGRATREGAIVQSIAAGARAGVLVEINCETDFAAKNDKFQAFCNDIAKRLLDDPKADLEAARVGIIAEIGENIQIARHVRLEVSGSGTVAAYIHHGAKVGVLVEVATGNEATLANADYKQLVKDITLQIAAGSPLAVTRDQVDPALIAKEMEIAAEQMKDKTQGKPAQVIEKMVAGKLDKYYQTVCLLDQAFVKQNEVTIKDHIASVGKSLGDTPTVLHFHRFQIGEAAGA